MLTKKYRRIKACSDFIIIQVSNFREAKKIFKSDSFYMGGWQGG